MDFKNKVVLVTGASSGIGAAIAVLFSQNGANVVIVGRNETKLQAVAEQCDRPLVIKADVTNDEDAKRIVFETVDKFGKLDVLVNNVGILGFATIIDVNVLKIYDEMMATNLRSAVHITNLAVPLLIESKGNVINISSVAGTKFPGPQLLPYGISKAGLDHFTRGAAIELAKHGVRINAISPGPVKTDIMDNSGNPTPWDVVAQETILGRVSEPEEIAELALFLASDKAKGVTGSNFVSDNGMVLKR